MQNVPEATSAGIILKSSDYFQDNNPPYRNGGTYYSVMAIDNYSIDNYKSNKSNPEISAAFKELPKNFEVVATESAKTKYDIDILAYDKNDPSLFGYLIRCFDDTGNCKKILLQMMSTFKIQPTKNPKYIDLKDLSNWKTYSNSKNNFTFKYPPNGYIPSYQSASVYITDENNLPPFFIFTIDIKDNPNHLTTRQVVEKEEEDLRNNKNAPWYKSQADKTLQTMKEYSNGGVKGLRLENFDEGYDTGFGIVVDATENNIYTFSINDGNGGVEEYDEKLLDQILSTFKFTQ